MGDVAKRYFFARNFTKTIIPNQCALSHVVRLAWNIKKRAGTFTAASLQRVTMN